MSWSLVGQIVVLTLLAIVVLIVVAGFIIGIHQHVTGKASGRYHDDLDLPEIPHFTVRGGVIRPAEDPSTVLDVLGRKDHQ